jgi:hypothetical protein
MTNLSKLSLLASLLLALAAPACSQDSDTAPSSTQTATIPLWGDAPHERPACVRGIHLTSWFTGSKKGRARIEKLLAETELNTVVIDIKESEGEVYIPGVKLDGEPNYVAAMPDIKAYIAFLKDRGVYVIARQVVFHDNKLAKMKPEWAVRSSSPIPAALEKGYRKDVWVDRKKSAWADPHNPDVWKYNIDIAVKAAELGFQEVQFDYIRFPSDGPTKFCVYSKPHSSAAAVKALGEFLERARERLRKEGVPLSIDVFGLTGSYDNDLGIGQKLDAIVNNVDVVSPMMYPSHYFAGEYGLKNPNASPYETLFRSIKDTKRVIGKRPVELRPWLQDFSLGIKYTGKHVRDQIEAAADQGVGEWLLWNPGCRYTRSGLEPLPAAEEPVEDVKPAEPAKQESKPAQQGKKEGKSPAKKV